MENDSSTHDSTSPVVLLALGFLVGAVVVGSCWYASGAGQVKQHAIVQNVTVDYLYETDPRSATGNSRLAVDSIEFFPGCVVLNETGGRSHLLALDRLRRFIYRPSQD